MAKITVIESGGLGDFSAEYLVVPDSVNLHDEQKAHDSWYINVYLQALRARKPGAPCPVQYVNFAQWLRNRGARDPDETELTVYAT